MTEAIISALDSGSVTCGIFVDFQKAFDTVNHDILLKKLEHYGFRGVINNWFRSYLTDRKQKVVINGFESESKILPHGVPQCSVLGPILFLIYINDLHRSIKYSTTYHFADDTNLLHISKDYKSLQRKVNYDLFSLHKWLTANEISLNDGKTELIYFRKNGIAPTLNIKLHGKTLIPSKYVKYLGIYLVYLLNSTRYIWPTIHTTLQNNNIWSKMYLQTLYWFLESIINGDQYHKHMKTYENINSQEIKDIDLLDYSRPVLKDKLTKHILSKYEE